MEIIKCRKAQPLKNLNDSTMKIQTKHQKEKKFKFKRTFTYNHLPFTNSLLMKIILIKSKPVAKLTVEQQKNVIN